jgi:3-hydroxyacyl-CoA dehydrogenase / enoyl-CoA hydratase / 3-hydroxybutyryl-CoA epimerase
VEVLLPPHGIFASNTSSLPITRLAEASTQPERFIGTHFFSPVDKMALIEVICGQMTSQKTLARVLSFAESIGKSPIVVNDSPGFFTSRVFVTYIDEGCLLLQEGNAPGFIDAMGVELGMPVGPLAIFDEVSLGLARRIAQTQKEMGIYHLASNRDAAVAVANLMIDQHGRGGRQYGGGFYEYPANGKKYLWPGLSQVFSQGSNMDDQDAKDRLLFRQVIEALKCLQQGVLNSAEDGNRGSLLGIGTPRWTGGLLAFVNLYGLSAFIDRCQELREHYGERFQVPEIVVEAMKNDTEIE